MQSNQYYLFKDKRFLPLFITQFFGAFNDNVFKNALAILITYKASTVSNMAAPYLVTIAQAIFIMPYILFSGMAGQIADKYEKCYVIRIIKFTELGILSLAFYGFYWHDILVLFFVLLLLGTHSAFFGPLKYSSLPDHIDKDELISANAYLEAGTFLSILLGTFIGNVYDDSNANYIVYILISCAVIGIISSLFIPKSYNTSPDIEINTNIFKECYNIAKYTIQKKQLFLSIVGISWFWFIGSIVLSQIPQYTKNILGADQTVSSLFLSVFSIGVGAGSMFCNKLLNHEVSTKYIVIASFGISVFGMDLHFASDFANGVLTTSELITWIDFLSYFKSWRILFDLFMIAAMGGVYIVPLYAIMQYFSTPSHRSRVIAANNLINSIFMVLSSIFVMFLLYLNFSVSQVILIVCAANILVTIYIYKLVPEAEIIPTPAVKMLIKFIFDIMFRVNVKGLENFYKAGKRTIVVANHISYLDAALLAVYLPEDFIFAVNTNIASKWWVKPFLKLVTAYPIDPSNAMATKSLIAEVKKNKKVAIFPEGRMSDTGSLMKIYEGPGLIAEKSDATILPVRIDGPQFTIFSRLRKFTKTRLFPKMSVTILPPVKIEPPEDLFGRERRKYIGIRLYDIMSEMMFESSDYNKTLYQSLIDTSKTIGMGFDILSDSENNNLKYRQLVMRSLLIGDVISQFTSEGENIGLMLPNATSNVVVFMGMQAYGRVPAMINYSSGANTITSACRTASVKLIITSRKFVKKAELEDLAKSLELEFKLIYLEDLIPEISIFKKIKFQLASYMPQSYYNYLERYSSIQRDNKPNNPACILFTSGTEGNPKAVVLSHSNIQANICQASAKIDFGTHDIAFNALPMFHSFGLTAGTLLPTLSGIKCFLYPSPLHYRIVPEIIYDIGATMMFGTDTFLSGYAQYAHPYDFYAMRYVFAGAEKLRDETRKTWSEKFGVRIFEGYGATETSPILSLNTPMHNLPGSVGRLLPNIEYCIRPVEGMNEGGRLMVKGPNVMLGYMLSDNPGVIQPPYDEKLGEGWYDTGDVVKIADEGYIIIQGRAKRFAKIAGEMVSLQAVENFVNEVSPEHDHATINIEKSQGRELIILFTTDENLDRKTLSKEIKSKGIAEIYLPQDIRHIKEIPKLSTGKADYKSLYNELENKN